MVVRLVPCGIREYRQAVIDRWIREKQRHHKQEKKGRTIVEQNNTYTQNDGGDGSHHGTVDESHPPL